MSICSSTTATYPDGHEVDGAAANAPTGTIARTNTIILFIIAPISQKVNQTGRDEGLLFGVRLNNGVHKVESMQRPL